jgi:hypothetical protein
MGPWVGLADDGATGGPVAVRTRSDSLVSVEFRYRRPGANGAALVWGIDGWNPVEPGLRPSGTELRRKVMVTPMTQSATSFFVVLRVPARRSLEYGFLATDSANGREVWDGSYATRTDTTATVDIWAKPDSSAVLAAGSDTTGLIATTVSYRTSFAAEVFVVWGINGWNVVPAAVRPGSTEIVNQRMKTRMTPDRGGFVAVIDVPPGVKLDYGFTITKRRGIFNLIGPMWDPRNDHPTIEVGRSIEATSALPGHLELQELANRWSVIVGGTATLLAGWAALYWLLGWRERRSRSIPSMAA